MIINPFFFLALADISEDMYSRKLHPLGGGGGIPHPCRLLFHDLVLLIYQALKALLKLSCWLCPAITVEILGILAN